MKRMSLGAIAAVNAERACVALTVLNWKPIHREPATDDINPSLRSTLVQKRAIPLS